MCHTAIKIDGISCTQTQGRVAFAVQFQLPGQEEILTASGEMMSLDDGKTVGVRFTNLPPQSAWAIEAFLKAA